jgi:Pyruvate/2-oxoacid:ferredoxin oxidoreductase delta subunit
VYLVLKGLSNGKCERPVRSNQRGIQCEDCMFWHHIKCIEITVSEYNSLSISTDSWFCKNCILPNFTDSYFETNNKTTSDLEVCQNQCNADVCITTRTEKYHYVLLTMRLLIQELKSSRRQLYGCHNGLVYRYGISVSKITTAMFYLSRTLSDPFLNHFI